jgi:hypothetical protein
MAVVTVKSTQITNRDASPRVLNNAYQAGGAKKTACGTVSIANGDSIASRYVHCTIPSNARISSVRKTHPDIGTTTAGDIGLYKTTQDGSAVVDADFFSAASVFNAGAVLATEVGFGNVLSAANAEKRVWEALGLTADPKISYDVCTTLTAAADAAGTLFLDVDYVI